MRVHQIYPDQMIAQARRTLWNHFILARTVGRLARETARAARGGAIPFCYIDTHAGSGRLPRPTPLLERLHAHRRDFLSDDYFLALEPPLDADGHPGSWLLAGRVAEAVAGGQLVVEIDVNDIDPLVVTEARGNREGTWVRFWSHDWFQFLRSHLSLKAGPNFVFIDPSDDDARGPAYAVDAAILLETLNVPYMITYAGGTPQEAIDQIGRPSLELDVNGVVQGAVLGGGAETVLLEILPDLRLLAGLLDGAFAARLPHYDDYSI